MPDRDRVLKVGIVGLGHLHPRAYMPLFGAVESMEVAAVAEPDERLRDAFCRDFGVRGYPTLEAMLECETLQVAAIFLPHADCPEAAEACARAGLHLMVEKPMAADVTGAERIVAAAERYGVKLTTGYCWRLHPVTAEFKRLIDAGVIGRPVGAEGRCAAGRLHRYIEGHAPWMLQRARSGGGPMYNLGVHWIDLFRYLLADEVIETTGQNVKINTDYDIEDNSFAHLRFVGGTIASLDISYTVPDSFPHGRDLYVSLRGTRGAISWAPAFEGQRDVLFVCSDHLDFAAAPRRHVTFELEKVPGYCGVMGLAYVRDFAEAILDDREPAVTGRDGVEALRVVEAIYRADREKRCVPITR